MHVSLQTPEPAHINTHTPDMLGSERGQGSHSGCELIEASGEFRKGWNHSRMLQQQQENTHSQLQQNVGAVLQEC